MKETIIIITILAIIIGADIYVNKYLKSSSDSLIKDLENLRENINSSTNKNEQLEGQANEIYDKWQKTEEEWAMLVLHSELDQIEIALIKMKTQIKENNLDIGLEELETSIFLINHINTKEKFCLKNIF